jgi:hypothetical protein
MGVKLQREPPNVGFDFPARGDLFLGLLGRKRGADHRERALSNLDRARISAISSRSLISRRLLDQPVVGTSWTPSSFSDRLHEQASVIEAASIPPADLARADRPAAPSCISTPSPRIDASSPDTPPELLDEAEVAEHHRVAAGHQQVTGVAGEAGQVGDVRISVTSRASAP